MLGIDRQACHGRDPADANRPEIGALSGHVGSRDDIEVAVLEHGVVGDSFHAQEGVAQSLALEDHRRRVDESGPRRCRFVLTVRGEGDQRVEQAHGTDERFKVGTALLPQLEATDDIQVDQREYIEEQDARLIVSIVYVLKYLLHLSEARSLLPQGSLQRFVHLFVELFSEGEPYDAVKPL